MYNALDGMSSEFHRWQGLTDDYLMQLDGLYRHVPGASARLDTIRVELAALNAEFARQQFDA